jgi:tetratricopeptide (TPR) repeat protein
MGRAVESKNIVDETLPILEELGEDLAPEEYYFMSPLIVPGAAQLSNLLVLGRLEAWALSCNRLSGQFLTIRSMGGVIGLTMLIYTRYLARDWTGVRGDADLMARAISEIEGAEHYLDLVNLVHARLEAMSGVPAAAIAVDRIFERPSVTFAMQHRPRYLLIAGDTYTDTGADDRARACFEEALQGGPFGSQQWLRSELLRRLGDLVAKIDRCEAESRYHEALGVARDQGALLFELRAALGLSELWRLDGRERDIARLLRPICSRFAEPCPDLAEAKAMLDRIQRVSV